MVEAGLADADDLGVSGQVDEPAGCVRRLAGRFVWMYADGAPDFVIRFSNGPDCTEFAEFRADRQHRADAGPTGARHHRVEVAVALQIVEVAMTVDQHPYPLVSSLT